MEKFFEDISFPYEKVRPTQDLFIRSVFETLSNKKNILVSAPTGSGKTISALAPAIYHGKKENKTIICLTSRQTQANQVISTIKDIAKKSGEKINYVAFIGKRSMCSHEERDLHPATDFIDFCKKARETGRCQFYKNVKNTEYEENIQKIINTTSEDFYSVEEFIQITSKTIPEPQARCGFCPYEVAALKAHHADVVIADYNYLFTPGIKESFMGKIGRTIDECIVIVDEAHNLPDRIRNSCSYSISSELIKNALKELNDHIKSDKYDNYITNIKAVIDEILFDKLEENKNEFLITKEDFSDNYLRRFIKEKSLKDIADELDIAEALIKEDKIISYVGRVSSFLRKWEELKEESYLRLLDKEVKKDSTSLSLKIRCLDPSEISSEVLNTSHSSILMSGTLSPLEMYRDILGVQNAKLLELDSPFSKENQLTLVVDDVTTKYSSRTVEMYKSISNIVTDALSAASSKNSIVFFPSYALMDQVLRFINVSILDRKVYKEQRFMTKDEKEKFVDDFKSRRGINEKPKVLFAVTSGSFSEGLDLPKEALEMVIVVGLPLGVPDLFTNALIRYFDRKFRKGELYGYVYPAMSKIIQAAGRCIRTEEDRGVILLMDNRFLWPKYGLSFPKYMHLKSVEDINSEIESFFDK